MKSFSPQHLCVSLYVCAVSATFTSACVASDNIQFKQTGDTAAARRLVSCPDPAKLHSWFQPISQLNADISHDAERLPLDCAVDLFQAARGSADLAHHARWDSMTDFHWKATELSHQPLYFDDQILERYGQTIAPCVQPVISGAKFFGTLPSMPYRMWINRTHDYRTTLGYHRPGSATPCYRDAVHWRWDAASFQGGAIVGALLLLP